MPKMVLLVLQILIPNANRMCQVQGDVNGKLIEEQRVGLCYTMSSAWILKQEPATDLLPLKSPSTHGAQSWADGTGRAREFFAQCLIIDSSLGVCCSRISDCTARTELLPFPGSRPDPNTAPGESGCKVLSSSCFQGTQSLRKGQAAISCKVPVNPLQPGVVKKHYWPLSSEQELLDLLANLWQHKVHKVINEFHCFICFINCPQIMMLFKSLQMLCEKRNFFNTTKQLFVIYAILTRPCS